MPTDVEQLELEMSRRDKTLRIRTVVLTFVPVIVAVVVLTLVGVKVDAANKRVEAANRQVEQANKRLEAQQRETEASRRQLEKSGQALVDILDITHQMQSLIERKQSFLRTSQEAGFLISIRLMFDRINKQYRELNGSLPNLKALDDRIWVTVLASGSNLADLKSASNDWRQQSDGYALAIYRAQNGKYALVIPGDGTFSFAYNEMVLLRSKSPAGIYFAESKDWGKDYLHD